MNFLLINIYENIIEKYPQITWFELGVKQTFIRRLECYKYNQIKAFDITL